jgi:hypothetical protein
VGSQKERRRHKLRPERGAEFGWEQEANAARFGCGVPRNSLSGQALASELSLSMPLGVTQGGQRGLCWIRKSVDSGLKECLVPP